MALRSSTDAVSKLVAKAKLDRHFQWSSMILAALPPSRQAAAIPAQWSEELTPAERSMLPVMAGELVFISKALKERVHQGQLSDEGDGSLVVQAFTWLVLPGFQPQDTANRQAEVLAIIGDATNTNFAGFALTERAAAKRRVRIALGRETEFGYNPIGDVLMGLGTENSLIRFADRVFDLEGSRRAALLAAQLRSNSVAVSDMEARVAAASLREPYREASFTWDATARAVVFNGLERGERGRHVFLY